MNSDLLISVIVPIYKVEKFLPACVHSILSQTYQNFEIILVDDGSPDHCGEMCDTFAAEDSRITVIHQKNGGLSAARNAGMQAAKGQYMCFIDSDDMIEPDMLKDLLSAAVKNGAQIACCGYYYCDEDGVPESNAKALQLQEGVMSSRQFEEALFTFAPTCNIVCNKIYAADILKGLEFRNGKIHEDEFFTWRAVRKAEKIALTAGRYYIHRSVSTSIMHARYSVRNLDKTEAILEKLNYYADQQEWTLAGKSALQFCTTMCIIRARLAPDDSAAFKRYDSMRLNFKSSFQKNKNHFRKDAKYSCSIFLINPGLYKLLRKTVKRFRKA